MGYSFTSRTRCVVSFGLISTARLVPLRRARRAPPKELVADAHEVPGEVPDAPEVRALDLVHDQHRRRLVQFQQRLQRALVADDGREPEAEALAALRGRLLALGLARRQGPLGDLDAPLDGELRVQARPAPLVQERLDGEALMSGGGYPINAATYVSSGCVPVGCYTLIM